MKNYIAILVLIGSVAESLKLDGIHVPHYRKVNESGVLECDYDLGPGGRLYAVKWFKDDEEFFRYIPKFKPPINTHLVEGVSVDVSRSSSREVFLENLDLRSTGIYRCEISAEAPSFFTVYGEGRMTVVHLPKEPPQINGNLDDEYEVGDTLNLNCTSALSFPPPKISWYINDQLVGGPDTGVVRGSDGNLLPKLGHYLSSSTLGLSLVLESTHFDESGTGRVSCISVISLKNNDETPPSSTSTFRNSASQFEASSGGRNRGHRVRNGTLLDSPFVHNLTSFVTVRGAGSILSISTLLLTLSFIIFIITNSLPIFSNYH